MFQMISLEVPRTRPLEIHPESFYGIIWSFCRSLLGVSSEISHTFALDVLPEISLEITSNFN